MFLLHSSNSCSFGLNYEDSPYKNEQNSKVVFSALKTALCIEIMEDMIMSKTTAQNNPKTLIDSSKSMAPTHQKKRKKKSKKPKRRKGIIIAAVMDENNKSSLDAQEKVLRRLAATENIYVTDVYRFTEFILPDHEIVPKLKELIDLNEIEVILCQSRLRLSANICNVLDFEILLFEHGAEVIYL